MKSNGRTLNRVAFVCPRTGKVIGPRSVSRWKAWLFPISGLICLGWFLVRVLPKPSRALYPCQRMAFPVASGFVAWLVGMAATIVAFRKAREFGRQRRASIAVACLAIAVAAGLHTMFNIPANSVQATPPDSHGPLGAAKGTNPGRVVLVHDKRSTPYTNGNGWWWQHTDQNSVDRMMSITLRKLTGTNSDQAAWDTIFRYYNSTHGRGNVGYVSGEKIHIKVNLVGSITNVNPSTYDLFADQNVVVVAPQMELALLRQLVNKAGVPQNCISIGDSICYFSKQHWDVCHSEFPSVVYLDVLGNLGRTKATTSTHRVYWGKAGGGIYYTAKEAADATYFINFANLKTHEGGGISLCGKNLYGAMCKTPDGFMHNELAYISTGMGKYRTLVDLLGHPDFGGKCILYLLDGLYTSTDARQPPKAWNSAPFNGTWPSVLLASQDPMAIDSVGFDMCYMEFPTGYPGQKYGADDYLHEGAQTPVNVSGAVYNPGNVGRPSSLGTHEHWNNSTDRKYSRNLGTSNGIELQWLEAAKTGDANFDNTINVADLQALVIAWASSTGQPSYNPDADFNSDSYVNVGDLQVLVQNWGS